jgi:hypothetical protein
MNSKMFKFVLGLVMVACVSSISFGDEKAEQDSGKKVDSAYYQQWAKFKPGSFAVVKIVSKAESMNSESTMTYTLKEVTPEKIVVEMKSVTDVNGSKMESPPQTMEYLAKVSEEQKKVEEPGEKIKEGKEDVKVAAGSFSTEWVEYKKEYGEGMDMAVKSKVWNSEKVPGWTVKMTSEVTGAATSATELELIEYKAM